MYSTERHHRAVEIQGRYTRRIGDIVALPHADADGFALWKIVDVVRGDDHAPVTLQAVDDARIMTIPASRLHRFESALYWGIERDNVARIVPVDDIPGEQDAVCAPETLDVLERLRHRELYLPNGIITSLFPQEIDRAVHAVLVS